MGTSLLKGNQEREGGVEARRKVGLLGAGSQDPPSGNLVPEMGKDTRKHKKNTLRRMKLVRRRIETRKQYVRRTRRWRITAGAEKETRKRPRKWRREGQTQELQ